MAARAGHADSHTLQSGRVRQQTRCLQQHPIQSLTSSTASTSAIPAKMVSTPHRLATPLPICAQGVSVEVESAAKRSPHQAATYRTPACSSALKLILTRTLGRSWAAVPAQCASCSVGGMRSAGRATGAARDHGCTWTARDCMYRSVKKHSGSAGHMHGMRCWLPLHL